MVRDDKSIWYYFFIVYAIKVNFLMILKTIYINVWIKL